MSGQRPALSVVAPCYNEAAGLTYFHERVTSVCRNVAGVEYEIVLVDDGSNDRTWQVIQDLASSDPAVVGLSLSRNYGHQVALTAGLNLCRGDRVLVIDADLQDPPELLPRMMRAMDEGADVVYGVRAQRHGETAFKRGSAHLFYRIINLLSDVEIPIDTGDFRLMSRRVLDALNGMPEQYRFVRGMVSWIGFTQVPIIYDRDARFAGETHYPFIRMLRLAIDAITSFSIRPLRIASILGFLFGVIGLVGLAYTLLAWATGNIVPGWASVMVAVLILGSGQLFVLGIIGEYVGRTYFEVKRRPQYVIDRIVSQANASATVEVRTKPLEPHAGLQ